MSGPGLAGTRVLVMGIGRRAGGAGAIRYAVASGAQVRVTDRGDPESFRDVVAEFADSPVEFVLGRHDETDFRWAEVVVRNPDVRRDSPYLRLAEEHGARIEMEMTLFLAACPAPTIGVTGTKGKTTTAMLTHAIVQERWPGAIVAGNMGRSALDRLGEVDPAVPVTLELSSFQLEGLGEHALAPTVAVITNVRADHLDRYPDLAAYADAKAQIVRHQRAHDWKVVPSDDPTVAALVSGTPAAPITFGAAPDGPRTLFVAEERFVASWDGADLDLGPVAALRLPGAHNQRNALAAAGAALAVGVTDEEIRRGLARFGGVPHRLEDVATLDGVDFVNDTTATTPEAAAAALDAFPGRPVVAIAGGSDKGLDLEPLAAALADRARATVLLAGSATPGLQRLLARASVAGPFDTMGDAVRAAADLAPDGGVVLLSPGCASFGLFVDEFDRGDQFRAAVHALTPAHPRKKPGGE
ncbi:MAG TPA: UDP-N-acetylmuramoyl-L-alanine--D-glutamate ligase [Acidimicrobiia bacterium]|nr:UDP-N-acetylmuramoyl-L-alanine--D-glutamate ligase [Acidimicrobiia bacterium]